MFGNIRCHCFMYRDHRRHGGYGKDNDGIMELDLPTGIGDSVEYGMTYE